MGPAGARAQVLRAALERNGELTGQLCDLLVTFDARMGRLETAILPVQERSAALTRAAVNVAAAREATEAQLALLRVPEELSVRLRGEVPDDVGPYLEDMRRLTDAASAYEEQAEGSLAAAAALEAATALLETACGRCEAKLEAVLRRHARDDAWAEAGTEPPASLPSPFSDAALPLLHALVGQLEALSYDSYADAYARARAYASAYES